MRNRASRFLVALAAGALLVGWSVVPAGGAEKVNLGSFVGAAGSHAVKISIGDIDLTVGGGESRAGYDRVQNSPIRILDKVAKATARGIVIPGLADTQVSCAPPKLSDKVAALETPEDLKPLLSLQLAAASCALGVEQLPRADHAAGEAVAEVRLTETVVDSVPQLNEFLDTLQGSLEPLPEGTRGQVNSLIDAIQTQLSSQPLLQVRVAPSSGSVTSNAPGIASVAPGSAVTLDVLGGVLQIEIAVAEATAAVADGRPTATSEVSFVRVKALNLLTPDPDDALIDQRISAPQDINLLEGTPLQTSIQTERGVTSTSCGEGLRSYTACANATADAVAVSLLADPLPNIGVELVHTEVLAAGNFASPGVKKDTPVLPKTGAGVAGVVMVGTALAFGGLGLRRRIVG